VLKGVHLHPIKKAVVLHESERDHAAENRIITSPIPQREIETTENLFLPSQ
jgi:hypothetical protein